VFPDAAEAMEWARLLVEEERTTGRFGHRRAGALGALFSMAVFESKKNPHRRQGLSDEIRRRISRHVLDHIGQRMSPGDLARLAGLSADYFVRRFKQSFGASPREWMLRQRLRQAAGLLAETDERVSEIATRLGYPDGCLFSRQFKAEFGSSPHRWRKIHTMAALRT
jgi:AraC-like DNA-binding protein